MSNREGIQATAFAVDDKLEPVIVSAKDVRFKVDTLFTAAGRCR